MISKKIILVGDFSTGKTSLIRRFVDNQFSDAYLSTIGVKISRKEIDVDGIVVQGLIWDIEGGTETKPVTETYIMGAHGAILVADITRKETIESIATYIKIVNRVSPAVPVILVLNKSDKLSEADRQKVYGYAKESYSELGEHIYLTSAKSGEGVGRMFEAIARLMLKEE
ncbi:Mll3243 protein [hydrothermal vent metagenome]|uniref:Mll3243 protein n=1 Tax=hydrothermal vent metagenome TaxID=652676 RepID=A0A1W1E7Q1_9ZZZZ